MPIYRLPYQDVFQQGLDRPYLKLHVTGLNGAEGDIWGLLDTGADATALPDGFRALMGYGSGDVAQTLTGLANGTQISTWVATRPVVASASGLAISFELWPTFVQGPGSPLWGRRDVFATFGFCFDESSQQFTLEAPDVSGLPPGNP